MVYMTKYRPISWLAAENGDSIQIIHPDMTDLVAEKFLQRIGNNIRIIDIAHVSPHALHAFTSRVSRKHAAALAKRLALVLIELDDLVAKTAINISILILIVNMVNGFHKFHPFETEV